MGPWRHSEGLGKGRVWDSRGRRPRPRPTSSLGSCPGRRGSFAPLPRRAFSARFFFTLSLGRVPAP